jgi:hypothetical protein
MNSKQYPHLQFFSVPKNLERRNAWFRVGGKPFVKYIQYCCEQHFHASDFHWIQLQGIAVRQLKATTIPSKHLNNLPPAYYAAESDYVIQAPDISTEFSIQYEQVEFETKKKRNPLKKAAVTAIEMCVSKTCTFLCAQKFSAKHRQLISSSFALLDADQKKVFYKAHIKQVVEPKSTLVRKSLRDTYKFSLELDGEVERVCQSFFLRTLNISQSRFHNCIIVSEDLSQETEGECVNVNC